MKKVEEMTAEEMRDRLTPKKPIVKTKCWGEVRALAYCPTCETLFFQNSDTFNEHCRDCGQALDWSEAREDERLKYLFEDSDAGIDVQNLIKKVEFLEGLVEDLQNENDIHSVDKYARDRLFMAIPGESFIHEGVECKLYPMRRDTKFNTYDGRRAWCIERHEDDEHSGLVYVAGDAAPSWWCCCYIDKSGCVDRKFVVPAMEECENIKYEFDSFGFRQYTPVGLKNLIEFHDYEEEILAIMSEAENIELSGTEAANGQ